MLLDEAKNPQHPLCADTKTHTAWISKRKGEYRCFLESNEYPHKAKGSYLEGT